MKTKIYGLVLFTLGVLPLSLNAQQWLQGKISNIRAYDKTGINVFEDPKDSATTFNGLAIKWGSGFTEQFQNLKHENTALNNQGSTVATAGANRLYPIAPGFMTSQANLYMDVQLADGIRLNVTSYLSARHHNETWVKGGFIQFDKVPFKGKFWDDLMKVTTLKIGHFEINYGDEHFRRTDGGNAIYNPFMEGYIMDAYTTEIGGEVYVKKNGMFGMLGITSGMIKGNNDSVWAATIADGNAKRNPSIYLKAGVDKKVGDNVRVRFSASYYHNNSSAGSGLTLYGGDRTGSNYQNVMEKWVTGAGTAAAAASASTAIAFSGRFNPGFSKKIDAFMLNAFVKASGLELSGAYETASGYAKNETANRSANQFVIDGVYRFGKDENLFVGARYNTVSARLAGYTNDVSVNRVAISAGWFLTKNILMKGEYVSQVYNDFVNTDYRNGGKFNGYVIEAVVGF
jgi:hypothetical protein